MENNETTLKQHKQPMETHKILQRYIPIVAINLIIIFVLSYFISPWSKVGTVSVVGNEAVYVQEIIDASHIRGGDLVLDTIQEQDQIEQEITEQLPQISETTVELAGLNNVLIQVKEFDTVAYIARDGSYLRVLEDGTVMDDAYDVSIGNQPVISNFQEGEALNLMIKELSLLDSSILNLISEIELVENRSNPLFIRVFMNNGNRVLSSIPIFSEKMLYYPQMVQAVNGEKGVFDMEAGVYFIPFVSEQEIDGETDVNESERQAVEGFED